MTPAYEIPAADLPAAYDAEVAARLKAEAKAARWKSDYMDVLAGQIRIQAECQSYAHLLEDIATRLGVSGAFTENLLVSEYGPLIFTALKTWREMLEARYTTPEGDPLFALEQTKREVERLTRERDKAQRHETKWKNRATSHYNVMLTLAQAYGFEGPSAYPDLGQRAQDILDEADEFLRGVLRRQAPVRDFYEVHTEDGRYYLALARTVGDLDAVLTAWMEHYDLNGPRKVVVTSPGGARRLLVWPSEKGGEE